MISLVGAETLPLTWHKLVTSHRYFTLLYKYKVSGHLSLMPTGFNVSLVTLFPQFETGCCSSGSLNEPCVVKWCLREPRLMLL